MDPATAFFQMMTAWAGVIEAVVKSQPPDVAAQQWHDWQADVEKWRTFWASLPDALKGVVKP